MHRGTWRHIDSQWIEGPWEHRWIVCYQLNILYQAIKRPDEWLEEFGEAICSHSLLELWQSPQTVLFHNLLLLWLAVTFDYTPRLGSFWSGPPAFHSGSFHYSSVSSTSALIDGTYSSDTFSQTEKHSCFHVGFNFIFGGVLCKGPTRGPSLLCCKDGPLWLYRPPLTEPVSNATHIHKNCQVSSPS